MAEALVIVESPAKAKTIAKYLGKKYQVLASMGHVRDLPKSKLGVNIEASFQPDYITIRGKGEILKQLKEAAKKAKRVYLAADPDREGEAIAWHLAEYLKLDPNAPVRVVFNEITEPAIKASFKAPRPINYDLVNAQQARRILDRLVGYKISPILWQKVKKGLSAGRVQSVAVKLIIDREQEIEQFVPEEYWTLTAHLGEEEPFTAEFYGYGTEKTPLPDEQAVKAVIEHVRGRPFIVEKVTKKERKRRAPLPFTTSTMQQEAAKRLGFRATKTMRIAQTLYEGLSLGPEGEAGLITYMRTDSTRISEVAQEEAKRYITETFGASYVRPEEKKGTIREQQGVQDAHEAIRPTSVFRTPQSVKPYLSRDELRLYTLIWERFVASQMSAAVYDTVRADMRAGEALFRANGSELKFPGFLKVYQDTPDEGGERKRSGKSGEEQKGEDEGELFYGDGAPRLLPPLHPEMEVPLRHLEPRQHFTQPPPRYTEATLVKALEELGIGRPSTYAPTLETIQKRGYVVLEDKRFHPTELGRVVTEALEQYFPEIVDVSFTAKMEKELDEIEDGEKDWRFLLHTFYGPFSERLEKAESEMEKVELTPEYAGVTCDVCGRPMVYKMGRYGKFLACSGFPECKHTKPIVHSLGIPCPKCATGEIVERRTKKGRIFYGCSRYPDCDFTSWDRPLKETCPVCGGWMVQKGKNTKAIKQCMVCGHKAPLTVKSHKEQPVKSAANSEL